MAHLPFSPFDVPLRNIVLEKFIKVTAHWLLYGDNKDFPLPKGAILAQMGGSVWETSFSLLYLCEVARILDKSESDKKLVGDIKKNVTPVVRWILSRLTLQTDDAGNEVGACWDGNTFDTAIAVRALLVSMPYVDSNAADISQTSLYATVVKVFRWLFYRFDQWETDVKYPVAASDVSEIMLSLLLVQQHHLDLNKQIVGALQNRDNTIDKADPNWDIVSYLLKIQGQKRFVGAEKDILSLWWGEYFESAEVVEALSEFYRAQMRIEGRVLSDEKQLLLDVIPETLATTAFYLQDEQVDATWGAALIDTPRVLLTYVKITGRHSDIQPDNPTIFKALRWLCDEKQTLPDGSFLHTLFITVYYAMTLLEIYKNWQLAEKPVADVYDDVLWSVALQPNRDRLLHLHSQAQLESMKSNLERISKGL